MRRDMDEFLSSLFSIPYLFLTGNVVSSGSNCRGRPKWAFCLGALGKLPTKVPTICSSSRRYLASERRENIQ